MHRQLTIVAAIVIATASARADDPLPDAGAPAEPATPPPSESPAPPITDPATTERDPSPAASAFAATLDDAEPSRADDLGDQSVGGAVGLAAGGGVTPGGVRISGHYLYQLSAQDWFDGIASFTFGGGDAECYRDRSDTLICEHGLADGGSFEIAAGVRRMFGAKGAFRPFARIAVGVAFVRFSEDEISGIAVPLHVGGGLRTRVADGIAVVAHADLVFGIGRFTDGLGIEPQLGLAVTAGAEFRLP